MSDIVLDTSAYLALIQGEEGANTVKSYLHSAIISTVNYAELLTVLQRIGMPLKEAEHITKGLIQNIVPYDEKDAILTSELSQNTRDKGLSLGDRACLALAVRKQCPVLTADKIWRDIELDIEIKILR